MMTDTVLLTEDKLDVNEAHRSVSSPAAGAVSVFIGMTRESFEGRKVVELKYEAYNSMAEQEMRKICRQIRDRWNVVNIYVIHRLGIVPVAESSVIITVSSVHRKDSIEAVQYCIDTLKATVPIWKQERYADGECEWKSNSECCHSNRC